MKTIAKLVVLLGMAVLVSGCGRDGGTRNVAPVGKSEVFELRMLGANPAGLSSALLPVASITATTQGLLLEVQPAQDTVDLTATNQAWLVGRVRVPEGVENVDFTLQFDDAGGYESRLGNGMVDASGATVSWRAPVEWLRRNGHAVVEVDLGRSLVATGADTRRLVPSAAIHY